jgi:hypothetical protein
MTLIWYEKEILLVYEQGRIDPFMHEMEWNMGDLTEDRSF